MKKPFFLVPVVAAAGLLVGSPAAKALNLKPELVTPSSSFSIAVVAANQSGTTGFYAVPKTTATFGVTATATGLDGQAITITSGEVVGATTTTDTFVISTPTNFITDTTLGSSNTFINNLQLDLGDANSGGQMVMLTLPITSYSDSLTATYGTSSTLTATLGNTTTLGSGNSSYSAVGAIASSPNTYAISAYDVRAFTYTFTYPTAAATPEPSTWAMLGLGTILGFVAIRHRHKVA